MEKGPIECLKNKIFINVINVAYQYLLYENNTFRSQGMKRKMFYQNKSREVKHMIKCPISSGPDYTRSYHANDNKNKPFLNAYRR